MSKLHYRATTLLLFACCILVTALDWVGNGKSIHCILDGDSDTWTIPANVINTYCYIMSTFILPKELAGSVVAPGVGTYVHSDQETRLLYDGEVRVQAYYQWVPFVLFLQACLFYAPHLLCKLWEGGKVKQLIMLCL